MSPKKRSSTPGPGQNETAPVVTGDQQIDVPSLPASPPPAAVLPPVPPNLQLDQPPAAPALMVPDQVVQANADQVVQADADVQQSWLPAWMKIHPIKALGILILISSSFYFVLIAKGVPVEDDATAHYQQLVNAHTDFVKNELTLSSQAVDEMQLKYTKADCQKNDFANVACPNLKEVLVRLKDKLALAESTIKEQTWAASDFRRNCSAWGVWSEYGFNDTRHAFRRAVEELNMRALFKGRKQTISMKVSLKTENFDVIKPVCRLYASMGKEARSPSRDLEAECSNKNFTKDLALLHAEYVVVSIGGVVLPRLLEPVCALIPFFGNLYHIVSVYRGGFNVAGYCFFLIAGVATVIVVVCVTYLGIILLCFIGKHIVQMIGRRASLAMFKQVFQFLMQNKTVVAAAFAFVHQAYIDKD